MPPTLDELTVADPPAAWSALGFAVEGDICVIGEVRIRLAGTEAGKGLTGWALRAVASGSLDGLATARSDREPPATAPSHPNGITASTTSSRSAPTSTAPSLCWRAPGSTCAGSARSRPRPGRRARPSSASAPTILEVVQEPAEAAERAGGGERPAFFWGLAFVAPDLDATVAGLGSERVSAPRPAVQPGRRIATLRRGAGLSVPVALMTPHVKGAKGGTPSPS